jgi:hypothetical protein
MAVGAPVTLGDVNGAAGQIARQIFSATDNVKKFKGWLDSVSVADLQALGMSAGDANILKSAIADLADLAEIFSGGNPVATLPHDYRTFSKLLIGTGLY